MAVFKLLHGEDAVLAIVERAEAVEALATVDPSEKLTVEKVIHGFTTDQSSLVVSDADDTFAVLNIRDDADERAIFVWLAYAPNLYIHGLFLEYLDVLAEDVGASVIEFCSPRRGWLRVAPKHGYEASKPWVTFRKTL